MGRHKGKRKGDSLTGYFRQLFGEHPEWLAQKSNGVILERYRADHNVAADDSLEKRVINTLANTKSQLRKQEREQTASGKPGSGRVAAAAQDRTETPMEHLEEQIDECLTLAKNLDRDQLESVINHLRRARNEVVWKLGQA